METWFEKMSGYLQMTEEIPFKEFTDYTQGFIAFLGANLDSLSQSDMVKARFMLSILQGNASDRAQRKLPEAKKYKKITEKTGLWVEAMAIRLVKSGMAPADIDAAMQALSDSIDSPTDPAKAEAAEPAPVPSPSSDASPEPGPAAPESE